MTAKGYREPIADRLERHSIPEPNSGCKLWLGAVDESGYGRMKIDGRREMARLHPATPQTLQHSFV